MSEVYAHLNEELTEVLHYPLSIYQVRLEFPDKSWPTTPDAESLEACHLVEVTLTTPPNAQGRNYQVVEVDPTLVNGVWTQTWSQQSTASSLAELKEQQLALLAETRYNAEVAGVLWNSYPVATDRESQTKLSAAYMLAINGYWTDGGVWKFDDGFARPMTTAQVIDMCLSVSAYVGGAFNYEASIADDIRNATTEAEAASWVWSYP